MDQPSHSPERAEKNLRRGQSAERATSFELTRQIVYISSIQVRNPSTTSLQTRAAPGCSPTLLANLGQQEASKTVSARKIAQPYKCVPTHPATAAVGWRCHLASARSNELGNHRRIPFQPAPASVANSPPSVCPKSSRQNPLHHHQSK